MFYLYRPLITLSLLFAACAAAFAQRDRDTYTGGLAVEVSGMVRMVDKSEPARGVQVRLERLGGGIVDQIVTDNNGKFRFQGLQRGYYTVIISTKGYNTVQQQADVNVVLRAYMVVELTPEKAPVMGVQPPLVVDARVPLEAQDEFEKGRSALALKDTREALSHLERAVALYPEFFEAQLLLGTTYANERRLKEAEAALSLALKIKPESAAPLFALGDVYRREKRYEEAEKALEKGLKLDENSWQGYFTQARLYWEMNDIKRAAPAIGHTLQLKPDFAEAHLLAGNILLKLNAPGRALVEYEEYMRLAPRGEFAEQTRQLILKLKKSMKSK
ncbi:MAG TPA: tetratricopeptide repeat protein [Pyrinomonadaceae bacterium]|jgi:Tfp pilus assembly protein PilF/5-hydroxyisourate hydrolase-like protein (transthyretin family)